MKNFLKRLAPVGGLLAMLVLFTPALRGAIMPPPAPEAEVTHIEQIAFDGLSVSVVYGVNSACADPALHTTQARLEPLPNRQKGWRVRLFNQTKQHCGNTPQWVRLADQVEVFSQIQALRGNDTQPYQLVLPAVTVAPGKPTPWAGLFGNPQSQPGKNPSPSPNPDAPYEESAGPAPAGTQWECTLYKRDGSRRDGFTGEGRDQADARAGAASGCKRTNNPNCENWAYDPAHTTCKLFQYRCVLWKNDGSRRDGFEGAGATEDEARAQSASGCKRTNNPNCDTWSNDDSHTRCERVTVQK